MRRGFAGWTPANQAKGQARGTGCNTTKVRSSHRSVFYPVSSSLRTALPSGAAPDPVALTVSRGSGYQETYGAPVSLTVALTVSRASDYQDLGTWITAPKVALVYR